MKKVAVIGAGVAGLATAARLQSKGYHVTIFEKNETIGGRMGVIKKDGFQFDFGPTIVMMPEVYQDLFRYCGKNPDDYIPMKQLETIYDVYFSADDCVRVPSDLAQLQQMLEAIEPGTTAGFLEFLTEIYKRYEIARSYFLERSFRSPWEFFNPKMLYQALKLKTFDSADHVIKKYVSNEKVQKLLAFQTLYIGIAPKQGPSLYAIIPMIELIFGVHFIKGGMRSMATGMEKLCMDLGVNIQTNSPVEKIIIQEGQARGVQIADTEYAFDHVVCCADFPYAMNQLIENKTAKGKYTPKKIESMDYSCSVYILYLGVKRDLKGKLPIHNIVFSDDFEKNVSDIFNGDFPEDPSSYVYVPSVEEASLAPEGMESVYVLTPVPELKTGNIDWKSDTNLKAFREKVLNKIQKIKGLENIESDIVSETVVTPETISAQFNGLYGAAFGLKPTLMQSNYFRPQNVSSTCKNLYFAGASVHPGAGVPIVLTSAMITAGEVLKDDRQ
ncbi:phytoene desaturase family protein [Vagococcus entomophilus]|uniref:Dehydrosqualene desaturase n=1 Tax=Vagococcus entomophilus TaxID=1160095 RepID=A0A430AFP4_9ENTE|nr:phytoene desaturase family protein [Vagococcus entomophilus]RSU06563.1 dehydrosqualene desaturase [Vagococcus entomophilus]